MEHSEARVSHPVRNSRSCGQTVAELSRGEGDYRESASVLRLPKPLRFFRCVQFALDSLGIDVELKIPRAHKARAGSIPASGTNFYYELTPRSTLLYVPALLFANAQNG